MSEWKNKLLFGDNLDMLREHIDDNSVDLIYLDPPFNSNATYNVLYQEKNGTASEAQIMAFEDTWHWNMKTEETYEEIIKHSPQKVSDLIQSLRAFWGQNDMMAYLVMMSIRLVQLRRVLKATGSIYLHCDPTASHYIKLVMDAVFGPEHFINEIVWKRSSAHSDTKQGMTRCGKIHDIIFFYGKGPSTTWNPVYQAYDQEYIDAFYRHIDEDGRRFRVSDLTAAKPGGDTSYEWKGIKPFRGRYWAYSKENMEKFEVAGRIYYAKTGMPYYKRYLDEMPGIPLQDLWTDIGVIGAGAAERLGYPTQKPESLLERIIRASSNEGDVILDPFCGCGTTINVAERLHRKWIGIDITHLAISLMRVRLHNTFRDELGNSTLTPYKVIGVPVDINGAKALAEENRYQFQYWALGLVDGMPVGDKKKGADSGIDGYIKFFDDNPKEPKTIVIQVKSGKVGVDQVRDLKGTMEREKAVISAFVTLNEPTKPMREEAITTGSYENPMFPGKRFPRLQILTIKELLEGKQLQYPMTGASTFKKAERREKDSKTKQLKFF